MKRKALFIGVNNYTNGLPALSCAVNDAGALQEFFEQCGYETSIIRNADTNNILSGIEEQTKDLKRDDVFLFFFAGHGYTVENQDQSLDRRLAGKTDRHNRIMSGQDGIRLDEIRRSVAEAHCSCVMILDACQSMVNTRRGSGTVREACTTRDLQAITSVLSNGERVLGDNGFVVINSCQAGDVAYELEEEQHGLFTLSLLDVVQQMRHNGENASFDECFTQRVAERMSVRSCGRFRQRPVYLSDRRSSNRITLFPSVDEQIDNRRIDEASRAEELRRLAAIRDKEEQLRREESRIREEKIRQELQLSEERKKLHEERKRQETSRVAPTTGNLKSGASPRDSISSVRYRTESAETQRLRQERLMREAHERQMKRDAIELKLKNTLKGVGLFCLIGGVGYLAWKIGIIVLKFLTTV